ncbi:MAG TPA: dienelactone hydrolase family protein [Candidatus Elarobacter sp.]|nr:dienelactone hydrolase family protein [Candidatus Elarobacter sp.]
MQQQRHPIARAEFVPLGGDLRAFVALPDGAGPFPGVILIQEAFGVNDYIQSEVERLASHGYAAISPDIFRGKTFSYDDFSKIRPTLEALTDEGMIADIRACAAYLDAQPSVAHDKYGAVGFCMGGRLAYLSAVEIDKVVAAASFYGGGIAPDEPRLWKPVIDRVSGVHAELLMIYGADDEGITPSEHGRVAEALSREKKRYEISVYPGAPHGFASKDRPSYRPEQAEAAWAEALALFDRTLR